ncbi:MAG: hypothetical protein QOC70_102 [Verrucomicrobiota bacterium]|jgi:hypothetical protein
MSGDTPVGFFTGRSSENYDLPHPKLGFPVILLVRKALLHAFDLLRAQTLNLADAKEDEVTAWIRSIIENDLRQSGSVAGFNTRFFDAVTRQGQVANFDGTRHSKSPDLCFKLRHDDREPRRVLSEFDALFVECKPVDAAHPAGGKYCDDGLIRFVRGDYSWAMQEAMMLAYVRDGRSIAEHLVPAMSGSERKTSLKTIQMPEPSLSPFACATSAAEALHVSKHRRGFPWPEAKGEATEITIYHVWPACC